jgi:prephenate dehydrogenase
MCPVWIKKNAKFLKKDAIVTDMMGVKGDLVYDIQKSLIDNEFISMHPMTGKELSGVTYSSSNIFNSSNMIIVPTEANTEKGRNFAKDLSTILGVKNVNELSPKEHDQIVGYVSHLTHVISVCLMNCYDSNDLSKFAGTAFRDITRIANINENIWSELFIKNKKALIPLIEAYQKQLELMKQLIEKEDENGLKKVLVSSANRRRKLNN